MLIKILILVILILINGIFSATEIAFLSINKYKLNKEIKNDNKKAKKIAELLSDQSTFLSAIQVVITISGFLASAFAAESFAGELASMIKLSFMSTQTLTTILVVVITLILSYFTLVFGELLPKKIGLAYSYKIAFKMINPINTVIKIFNPIIVLLKKSTELFVRLLKIKKEVVEEDTLKDTITDSNLEELEKKLLLNVFEFNDVTVKEVMTPKKEVISLDIEDSNETLKRKVRKTKYTRFPVTKNGEIIGVLNIKDLIVNETNHTFKKNIRKVTRIKSTTILDDAFILLNNAYEPIAIVEEDKKYIGIITMEDILEHIIGDIFDEYDKDKEQIKEE
jgi:putative hemolysin